MVLEKLNYLVECITQDLIQYLMEDNKISMEEAMDIVYNSKTFEQLNDFETHLYYESSSYVYEYLKDEIKINIKSQGEKISNLFDFIYNIYFIGVYNTVKILAKDFKDMIDSNTLEYNII